MAELNKLTLLQLAVLLLSIFSSAQAEESPRIALLRAAATTEKEAAAAIFWQTIEQTGTPIVEPLEDGRQIRVTFVLRAAPDSDESDQSRNAGLIGSFVPGGSRELVRFERIAGTDVLQRSLVLDAHSRYRYYLAWPQGRRQDAQSVSRLVLEGLNYELFADPRSALSFVDDFDGKAAPTSYFEGPLAAAEPWLAERGNLTRGNLETIDVASQVLADTRKVTVYTPPGYGRRAGGYPFILLFDREPYLQSVPTATILDNLITDGLLPPLVAVLVSAIDGPHRTAELGANPRLRSFVIDELLPQVRKRWSISRDPHKAVIAGSSLGGLASSFIARSHPEVFGNVLSMSGSYWWYPAQTDRDDDAVAQAGSGWLPRQFLAGPPLPLRMYVCVGVGEGEGMLAPNRLFRDVLTAKGYAVRYEEFHGDHSYLNWRDSLVAGLRYLLADV